MLEQPSEVEAYLQDAAHHRGSARAVAAPIEEGEWAWLLSREEPVLPVGAQSSLTRGATPVGGIVATTREARAILALERDRARVQAGVPLAALEDALRGRGLSYPPVPTFTGAFAGGVVATNAAGPTTFKHGTTRRWVRALTVVLPGGDVLDLERGQHRAHARACFELVRTTGQRVRVPTPTHALPSVPKCSAGYHSEPRMDLVDLFVGSEGTLGVVTEVELRVVPRTWEPCGLFVSLPSVARALELCATLRLESRRTWVDGDPRGVDVSAIELVDEHGMRLLRETSRLAAGTPADRRQGGAALLVLADLPARTTTTQAQDDVAALDDGAHDAPLTRLLRIVREAGGDLEGARMTLPGDAAGLAELLALREAVPIAVGDRIRQAQAAVDPRVRKVGGDVIVPFGRLAELLELFHDGAGARGLEALTWGHVSDGNVHPNVIPRSLAEVEAGEELQLEVGRAAIRMGGSPLAEHGVGRHPLKQRLLQELVGTAGVEAMRATKTALDPRGVLAPGVLWPVRLDTGASPT
jgi:D-lactate dehydrogenase (cytochrome)